MRGKKRIEEVHLFEGIFHDCKRRGWTVFHLRSSGMTTTDTFALDFFALFSLSLLILSVDY